MIKNAKHEIQNPIARRLAWSAGLAGVIDPPWHLVFWGKFLTLPKRWVIKMALGRGKGFYNPELGFKSKTNGELTNGQWVAMVAPSGVMLLEFSETCLKCLTPPWGFEDQTGTIWGMSQTFSNFGTPNPMIHHDFPIQTPPEVYSFPGGRLMTGAPFTKSAVLQGAFGCSAEPGGKCHSFFLKISFHGFLLFLNQKWTHAKTKNTVFSTFWWVIQG